MSWDVVLFSSSEKITDLANLAEETLFPVDFDAALLNHFEDVKRDDNHISIKGNDYEIDFFTDDEHVSNKMLSLYGEKALFELVLLAKTHNWQVYDTAINQMIDLNNPALNGYQHFNEYRDWVLKKKS